MKVKGSYLDPNGWLEVRLLEVAGEQSTFSTWPMVVKRRWEQNGSKMLFEWRKVESKKQVSFVRLIFPMNFRFLCSALSCDQLYMDKQVINIAAYLQAGSKKKKKKERKKNIS